MTTPFAHQLDALATWRRGLERQVAELERLVEANDLDDDTSAARALESLRQRLAGDRMRVAFVAEFSRGKSELINAIFFGDAGRRVLPATPGRTTMCPVEIAFDAAQTPRLALLPIETRLESKPLAQWREQPDRWTIVDLDPRAPQKLSESLAEVMRTKAVDVDTARKLGLWHDERPEDNPPAVGEGLVEVPAWRHATINYPHPLLRRGLVVLDTPGLNAIGAEPELTLSMLPSAHAVVFILGADTGVTKSDLAMWREHLGAPGLTRLVALNKIDTLADPLLSRRAVDLQIESQRQATATQLGIDVQQVFAVSARQALAGRIEGRSDLVNASRLVDLEQALGAQLLPQRHRTLGRACDEVAQTVERSSVRRVNQRRRQVAEQIGELRQLRGKNASKTALVVKRVQEESKEFERGASRITAIQQMHTRQLRSQRLGLARESVDQDVLAMHVQANKSMFNLGAKKAFAELFERLKKRVASVQQQGQEAFDLLDGSFKQLNNEFGFALSLTMAPDLTISANDLDVLERSYAHYLGLGNAWKLADDGFMDQFRRMLKAKLHAIFEQASKAIDAWHAAAAFQLESQLRERREMFERRNEALQRVSVAQDELEARIAELESQDQRLQALALHARELVQAMRRSAADVPRELAEPVPAGADLAAGVPSTRAAVVPAVGATSPRATVDFIQSGSADGATDVDTAVLSRAVAARQQAVEIPEGAAFARERAGR